MEWPAEKLLRLIELFKSKVCLWDPQDRNYKKSAIKDKAWNSISEELSGNAIETKKKMESLLASYRRERKKYELARSSSRPETVYISKWFAFKAMSFMNNRFFVRRPRDDVEEYDIAEHLDCLDETLQQDSSHSQDAYEPKRAKPNNEETPCKTTAFEVLPSVPDSERECNQCCFNKINVSGRSVRDDSDIFGEYVAAKHRKYCDHVKNVIEHQIAQILFDADMGIYNPGTTTTITISARSPIIDTKTKETPEIIFEK